MKMKKTVSILVVLSMLLTFCLTISATNSINANSIESNVSEQIEKMVSLFYSENSGYYSVGNAITIYNSDEPCIYYIIPIYCNEECVGRVELDTDGGVVLSNDVTLCENIYKLDASEYIFYTSGGVVYAESFQNVYEIYDSGYNLNVSNDFALLPYSYKIAGIAQHMQIVKSSIDVSAVVNQTKLAYHEDPEILPMGATPILESKSCSIKNFVKQNGYNICWAACVATIVNYKKSSSYTAEAIATAMGHNYKQSSYTGGSTSDTISALSKYGLTYSNTGAKLSWVKVKSNITNKTPFIIGMTSSSGGHMLTGYGYQCQSGDADSASSSRYVTVWEPNGSKMMLQYNASTYSIIGSSWRWSITLVD